jgi:uncharacterized membrane protein
MKSTIILLTTVMLYISCSKSSGGGTPDPPTPPSQNACSGTAGSLFTAARTIIRTNCAISGCHTTPNPQNGINFSDDCQIVTQKNLIKARAIDAHGTPTQMPPPPHPGLTAAERQTITNWLNAGGRYTD